MQLYCQYNYKPNIRRDSFFIGQPVRLINFCRLKCCTVPRLLDCFVLYTARFYDSDTSHLCILFLMKCIFPKYHLSFKFLSAMRKYWRCLYDSIVSCFLCEVWWLSYSLKVFTLVCYKRMLMLTGDILSVIFDLDFGRNPRFVFSFRWN